MPTVLKQEKKDFLLSLKTEQITYELMEKLFADKVDGDKIIKSSYKPQYEFDLKAGEYFNTSNIRTNVGLFIINLLLNLILKRS